jgi:ornithine carbamoyltransferase
VLPPRIGAMVANAASKSSGFSGIEQLAARAASKALVLHCVPAYRGKEITAETLEKHAGTSEKMIALLVAKVQLVNR